MNEAAFKRWLTADGEDFKSEDWLHKGKVLKWTKIDGEADYIPTGKVFDVASLEYTSDSSGSEKSKKKIIAVGAAAAVLAGVVIGGC